VIQRYHKRLAALTIAIALAFTLGALPAAATTHNKTKHHATKRRPSDGIGVTHVVENETKQYQAVTFVALIDPAQPGNQYLTPTAGTRFVAVEIKIAGKSPGNDMGDANNNVSVVGSNNQVYSPNFGTVSECTDFDSGQYTVTKGESEVGCVNFQIPMGVGVAHVKYNPNSGFSTNEAEWTLSPPL